MNMKQEITMNLSIVCELYCCDYVVCCSDSCRNVCVDDNFGQNILRALYSRVIQFNPFSPLTKHHSLHVNKTASKYSLKLYVHAHTH